MRAEIMCLSTVCDCQYDTTLALQTYTAGPGRALVIWRKKLQYWLKKKRKRGYRPIVFRVLKLCRQ